MPALVPPPSRLAAVRSALAAVAVVACFAAPARAQHPLDASVPPPTSAAAEPVPAAPAAPFVGADVAGVHTRTAQQAGIQEAVVQQRRRGLRQSQILMIVGCAAILLGFLTDDDAGTVLILGGAAVGLFGLYLYLQ